MASEAPNEAKASELNNRGYDLAEEGRWEEAIPYYEQALRHNPRNVHALTNMGNALQAVERLSEALTFQDRALAVEPDNSLAWANKAVILSGLGRRPDAVSCYEHSIAIDPSNKVTWFNKGTALFLLGRHSDAIECYDHILNNLDPGMKNALGAKAEVLKAQGKPKAANKCMERMHSVEADSKRFTFELTRVNIKHFGTEIDSRKVLRGFEIMLRKRTHIPQISADFMPSGKAFEPTRIAYSRDCGYRITLQLTVLFGDSSNVEDALIDSIKGHARKNGVRPAPPPIPRTSVSVEGSVNFNTHSNEYDAIAHDGGCLVAFYRNKSSGAGVVMRHILPIGVVHYEFERLAEYRVLIKDAEEHCSAFLDLSYLDSAEVSEGTIRVFLQEHELYGWRERRD